MRIIFMGTPDLAQTSLKKINEAGYPIIGVVTAPDKPKGRGMKYTMSPVKEYALENHFPVYQPEKIRKNKEFIEELERLSPDIICVVAYGKILPKALLDIPKYGCINVHPSLLPHYRGPAPIQWAVLNGDSRTGVSIMYLDEGMDTGDIIMQKEVSISENETTGELWDRISDIGADLLVETIKRIENGTAERKKQKGEHTIAPMIEKEMAKINWKEKNARQLKNLIRGLNPIMGAYTFLDEKKYKFWMADIIEEQKIFDIFPELREYQYKLNQIIPGTVLFSDDKSGLYIKANEGVLSILEIQAENAKKMNIKDFLRGNKIEAGDIFE